MNAWAFRAALRASARVAFGVAASACGGVISSGGEPSQVAVDDGGAPVDAGSADDATVVLADGAACDPPAASSVLPEGLHVDASAAISEATFDCCVARLETIAPGEEGAAFRDAAANDPSVQACCAAVIARLDYEIRQDIEDPDASQAAVKLDEQTSAPVRWECCGATPSEGPTCTPWGPPMPPAMPQEVVS